MPGPVASHMVTLVFRRVYRSCNLWISFSMVLSYTLMLSSSVSSHTVAAPAIAAPTAAGIGARAAFSASDTAAVPVSEPVSMEAVTVEPAGVEPGEKTFPPSAAAVWQRHRRQQLQ